MDMVDVHESQFDPMESNNFSSKYQLQWECLSISKITSYL